MFVLPLIHPENVKFEHIMEHGSVAHTENINLDYIALFWAQNIDTNYLLTTQDLFVG